MDKEHRGAALGMYLPAGIRLTVSTPVRCGGAVRGATTVDGGVMRQEHGALLEAYRPQTERPLQVLCVCTANVCRSPVAQQLLAAAFGDSAEVSSAGLFGLDGAPMSATMAGLLRADGLEPAVFGAQLLRRDQLRDADLVLTMTARQRADTVQLLPESFRRTFTLREFARLISSISPTRLPAGPPAARLRVAVPLAAVDRGALAAPVAAFDISDPYGKTAADYRRAYELIATSAAAVAAFLAW